MRCGAGKIAQEQDAQRSLIPGLRDGELRLLQLELFGRQRAELVALLRTLSPEEWARSSVHPEYGRMSIADIVTMIAKHEDEHCRQAADISAAAAPHL